jgi:hypothetical protein
MLRGKGLLAWFAFTLHPIQITLLGGESLFFFDIDGLDGELRMFRGSAVGNHAFINALGFCSYPPASRCPKLWASGFRACGFLSAFYIWSSRSSRWLQLVTFNEAGYCQKSKQKQISRLIPSIGLPP